jgi:hypothetical protein
LRSAAIAKAAGRQYRFGNPWSLIPRGLPIMVHKQVLLPDRVRRPPSDGWSWIDRRFLREHAPRLSHEAILLYFFLVAVSDKDGLSFYGDASIAVRLRMGEMAVVRARDELVAADLLAYRAPLAQVLSLPRAVMQHRAGGLARFGEVLRTLAAGAPACESAPTGSRRS